MPTEDWKEGYQHGFRDALELERGSSTTKGEVRKTARRAYEPKKKKRKASKYNKVYSKHYKKLKKKHPRSGLAALSKKAHRATKKELK